MLLKNIEILSNVTQSLKNKLFKQLIYISSDAVFKDDARIINEFRKTPLSLHGNMHLIRENVLKIISMKTMYIETNINLWQKRSA